MALRGFDLSKAWKSGMRSLRGEGKNRATAATPMSQAGRSPATQAVSGAKDADPFKEGYEKERKAKEAAEEAILKAGGRYEGIKRPNKIQQYAAPTKLGFNSVNLGGFDAAQQGDSRYQDVQVDPRFAQAQNQSLGAMTDIVNSEGLTAADQANLSRIQQQTAMADRGRREAIQQRMRQQGMAGSGNDLLAQLSSGQAATSQANQMGLDVAAMGQQRRDQAIRDMGGMASDFRAQDFGEQAAAAEAQDAINRFNTANTQESNRFGAEADNQQRLFNTSGRNRINEMNTLRGDEIRNANADIRRNMAQQAFDNEMALAQNRANADLGLGGYYSGQARDVAGQRGQILGGLGQIGLGAANIYMNSDENSKTEIEPLSGDDIDQFLNSVNPAKFKYKNEKMGPGARVGIMAQDIEPTEVGAAIVKEGPDGKVLDNNNLLGAIVSSLSHLHQKQKQKENDEKALEPNMIIGSP